MLLSFLDTKKGLCKVDLNSLLGVRLEFRFLFFFLREKKVSINRETEVQEDYT